MAVAADNAVPQQVEFDARDRAEHARIVARPYADQRQREQRDVDLAAAEVAHDTVGFGLEVPSADLGMIYVAIGSHSAGPGGGRKCGDTQSAGWAAATAASSTGPSRPKSRALAISRSNANQPIGWRARSGAAGRALPPRGVALVQIDASVELAEPYLLGAASGASLGVVRVARREQAADRQQARGVLRAATVRSSRQTLSIIRH